MNNIILINKLDKQLEKEYLNFFKITDPNEYAYYTRLENISRTQSYIDFFITKKDSLKLKKNKKINDYILIKLCTEKIEVLTEKLQILKENSKVFDYTEINKKLGIIGSVPEI